MAYINLQLAEEDVTRTTRLAEQLHISRAAYIRQAIHQFNEQTERQLLAEQLRRASHVCRENSLAVCQEFEVADAPLGDE